MSTVQITPSHLARKAAIYVRQSSPGQVLHNRESQRLQYGLVDRAVSLAWPRSQVIMIDEDLGVSGRGQGITRIGFDRLVAEVGLGHIGIVVSIEVVASDCAAANGCSVAPSIEKNVNVASDLPVDLLSWPRSDYPPYRAVSNARGCHGWPGVPRYPPPPLVGASPNLMQPPFTSSSLANNWAITSNASLLGRW